MRVLLTESHKAKTETGVEFTLRRVTDLVRQQMEDELAPTRKKLQALYFEQETLTSRPEQLAEDRDRLSEISRKISSLIRDEFDVVHFDTILVSTNLELEDGVRIEPSLVSMRKHIPEALCREILDTIYERSSLGSAELKN
jgi:hypothetical protein